MVQNMRELSDFYNTQNDIVSLSIQFLDLQGILEYTRVSFDIFLETVNILLDTFFYFKVRHPRRWYQVTSLYTKTVTRNINLNLFILCYMFRLLPRPIVRHFINTDTRYIINGFYTFVMYFQCKRRDRFFKQFIIFLVSVFIFKA